MADDIGWFNVSCYNHGIMGYRTPNIDRIAKEGAMFTDFYGQQSCTAGRAAFITGQSPIRTGLTKVGMPGATLGLQRRGPERSAQFMKNFGYATGQFGKNHLGDRNEHLPTVHGFDEFFGNLYHLNAEEEPEYAELSEGPAFPQEVRPARRAQVQGERQGRCDGRSAVRQGRQADDREHRAADQEAHGDRGRGIPRRGARLHGPQDARKATPWFCYFNPTRMHVFTHLKPASKGKTGLGLYPDGMVELDGYVGQLLKKLEDLGVADNTIVVFTTDNGAEVLSWPDGGATPFRGEKDTNWEGGWRVPVRHALARRHRARPRHQRHLLAAGLHSDLRGGRTASPTWSRR